jgi:hypothetical protein
MGVAYVDTFRKILLQPDGVTLTADDIGDTLTITRSDGVAFNPSEGGDSFEIDVDYQLSVPVGTTELRLNDVNSNYTGIEIRAGSNISVVRNSDSELIITATVGGSSKAILNATQTNPVVITTSAAHSFSEGTPVTITDVVGMTQLNGNEYYADILTSTTFALYSDDELTASVDGTGFSSYSSGGVATGEYFPRTQLAELLDVETDGAAEGRVLTYQSGIWRPSGTATVDIIGSVFADDSTVLVDSVNGKVVGDVDNIEVVTTTVQGRDSANLNIYRGTSGTVSLGDASSGDVTVSDSGINITSTAGVGINGAATGTVEIGTGATTGNVTIGKVGNTTTINGTFNAALTGNVTGNVDGDINGSVFADDSGLLVDSVTGKIVGDVDTTSLTLTSADPFLIQDTGNTPRFEVKKYLTSGYELAVNSDTGSPNLQVMVGSGSPQLSVYNTFATVSVPTTFSDVIRFEGTNNDSFETTLFAIEPIQDATIEIPNESGTMVIKELGVIDANLDGDVEGSVYGDDSTLLVDGVNSVIPAANLSGALPAIDGSALTGISAVPEGSLITRTSGSFSVTLDTPGTHMQIFHETSSFNYSHNSSGGTFSSTWSVDGTASKDSLFAFNSTGGISVSGTSRGEHSWLITTSGSTKSFSFSNAENTDGNATFSITGCTFYAVPVDLTSV